MGPGTTSASSQSIPQGSAQQQQAPATSQGQAAGPAAPGVLLSLDQTVESLHASGRLSTVLDTLAEPLKDAASKCGTTITAVNFAGGGLLVHLADPARNTCLAQKAANLPNVVSAEEDMVVRTHWQ